MNWDFARGKLMDGMKVKNYPMYNDNPYLSVSEDEFLKDLRSARKAFEEKYTGKSNLEIDTIQRKEREDLFRSYIKKIELEALGGSPPKPV